MIDLYEEFKTIVGALTRHRIPFGVCGGLAMAAHGFPRATQDIDLLVPEEQIDADIANLEGTRDNR